MKILPSNMKIERRSAAAQAAIQSASVALSASPLISLAVGEFIYSHSHLDVGEEDESSPSLLPEDIIVAEILPRLHIHTLFRFKCVSKAYDSIISDPEFAKIYSTESQPWVLFPLTPKCRDRLSKNVKDLTDSCDQDDQLPISLCSVSLPNDEHHDIRASSNGLILSGIYRPPRSKAERCGRFFLHVSNPLTKQCVPIPQSRLFYYTEVMHCISTRPVCGGNQYKIVLIQYKINHFLVEDNNGNASVEIFSSDTGSWAYREVTGFPADFYHYGTVQANFAHRGVLHWLGRKTGTVVTYDPYDNPDRFGRIPLPQPSWPRYGSLIYSGDEEMVKYCEMDKGGPDVVMMRVWRLVNPGKGEWFMEGEFSFPSFPRLCKRLLLAPNPCDPDLVCHPYVIDKTVMVINLRTGSWEFVNVLDAKALCFVGKSYKRWPLLPLQLSPWSSPFYA